MDYLRETDRIIETTLAPAACSWLDSAYSPKEPTSPSWVPASKMREVTRVAVFPLSQASTEVTFELNIHADGGLTGISRETLNLVVLEGLRQVGFSNVAVNIEEKQ